MKVILHRSGSWTKGKENLRFVASDEPQEVPPAFGKTMVKKGYATPVQGAPASRPPEPEPLESDGEDED